MKKTVAIVGSHPKHYYLAPWDNPEIDIWVFNSAPLQPWCKRVTASFEIHGPEEYTNPLIEYSGYWEYLQSSDNTVYMAEYDPRIKSSTVYPLQEIIESLVKDKFFHGDKPHKYFTSSPCYAIALAVYLGYERIEMYGIEMETNSEYIYQRPGVAWWWAFAGGHGIEMYLPEQCVMFDAPLYGYEDDRTVIGREDFEEHAKTLQIHMEEAANKLQFIRGQLDQTIKEIEKERMKANGKMISPKKQKELGEKFEGLTNEYEQSIANYALIQGQLTDCRMWQTKIEKMMIARGKAQEVQALTSQKVRSMGVTA